MELPEKTLAILVLASLGLNVLVLFILAVSRGTRGGLRGGPGRRQADDMVAATLDGQGRTLERLEGAIRQLGTEARRLDTILRGAVQHVSVVRFDAFEDMGGRLSFSAALLDANGDGVVITSINGRQDTRCYAKPVREGESTHNLSEEEEIAIREALAGARQTVEAR